MPSKINFLTASDGTNTIVQDVDLPRQAQAIFVGTGGDLVVETPSGNVVTFNNVVSGSIIPIRIKQVRSATNADDMTLLFE